jgi:TorA maturation chaperone TorD
LRNDRDSAVFRSSIYRVLALAFSTPKGEDQAKKLYAAILEAKESLGQNESIASKSPVPEQPSFSDLAKEHLRLFVGPGHVKCPPYESVVRKDRPKFERGLVMGPSTADVRKRYAAAGLAVSKSYTDLPDHIAAELEFMHFLCAEESNYRHQGNQEEVDKHQNMELDFLRDHLEPWVSDFTDCVLASTNSPFYKEAATLLKEFTKNEFEYFSEGKTE